MKQLSYGFKDKNGLLAALDKLQQEMPKTYMSVLASVYTDQTERNRIEHIKYELSLILPRATVVGGSSDFSILDGEAAGGRTLLVVQFFFDTVVTVGTYDFSVITPSSAGRALSKLLLQVGDLAGVELLTLPGGRNIRGFLDPLSALSESVPVFGGVANHDFHQEMETFIFARDEWMTSGAVVILFRSKKLHFFVYGGMGWKPLGVPMSITKLSDDGMTVEELDHQPAFSVYEKYLHVTREKATEKDLFAFPLMLERNGEEIARLPVEVTAEGYLKFACGFTLGEKLRLAYGDPEEILTSSKCTLQYIAFFAPEAIMFFDCVGRQRFMRENAELELRPFEEIASNVGFFSHGEIMRAGRNVMMMNMLLLTVGMREAELGAVRPSAASHVEERELTDSMSLVQRLASFITVVSKELEEANQKLERLARQDRLTEICNRGEIESIMQNRLDESMKAGTSLSVIMLDIDNFKMVNDKYGRAVGDTVLKYTANALRGGLRSSDALGRWGGEEFLIVLPGFALDEAYQIAERLRLKLASQPVLPDGGFVTASFSVAEHKKKESFDEFYWRIDRVLYNAKRNGKNCVEIQDDSL